MANGGLKKHFVWWRPITKKKRFVFDLIVIYTSSIPIQFNISKKKRVYSSFLPRNCYLLYIRALPFYQVRKSALDMIVNKNADKGPILHL